MSTKRSSLFETGFRRKNVEIEEAYEFPLNVKNRLNFERLEKIHEENKGRYQILSKHVSNISSISINHANAIPTSTNPNRATVSDEIKALITKNSSQMSVLIEKEKNIHEIEKILVIRNNALNIMVFSF